MLEDAELVGGAPALYHFGVGVEAGDLEAAGADAAAGGGDAEELAAVGSGDGVGEGDLVVVGDQLFDIDGEVGEGGDHLLEEGDVACRAANLSGGGVVIDAVCRDDLVDFIEVVCVYGFAEELLRGDIVSFAHARLDARRRWRVEVPRRWDEETAP